MNGVLYGYFRKGLGCFGRKGGVSSVLKLSLYAADDVGQVVFTEYHTRL